MAIRWDKLTVKSQEAVQQAQERATTLGNPEVLPVHLLLALVEDREGVVPSVLGRVGVPNERLELELHQIEEKLPLVAGAAQQPALSQAMGKVLDEAFREATNFKDEYVSTEHLLLGITQLKGDVAREESKSHDTDAKLKQQDQTIAELQAQLKAAKAASPTTGH